jgi:hypothetical protein
MKALLVKKGNTPPACGFTARCRKLRLTIFRPLEVKRIWFDEIDGETPSMARETRAVPKTHGVVRAQS